MTAFYVVAIIGCFATIADEPEFDCWVKFDSDEAFKKDELTSSDEQDCFNVTSAVNSLCVLGICVLSIQFLLLIFANKH